MPAPSANLDLPPIAGWPLRLMAAVMDLIYAAVFSGILLIIVWVAVADVGTFQMEGLSEEEQQARIREQAQAVMAGTGGLAIILTLLVFNVVYWILSMAHGTLQATLGKKLFGLAVLKADGQGLGLGTALVRGAPMLLMGALFLAAAWTGLSWISWLGVAVGAVLVLDFAVSAMRADSRGIGDLLAGTNVHRVRAKQAKTAGKGKVAARKRDKAATMSGGTSKGQTSKGTTKEPAS